MPFREHDSPERLEFGSRLFAGRGVHIAGYYDGTLRRVDLSDRYGSVHFYLLPFIKPAMVRAMSGEEVGNTDEAVRAALRDFRESDTSGRHVLIAHQFVCAGEQAPETCDSETASVGGSDNVDVSCFDGFDYVALGHLHRSQRIGRDTVRYSGSPLKYSLSECGTSKSFTLVTLGQKGEIEIEQLPVTPLRDLRRIRGGLRSYCGGRENPSDSDDSIHAVLPAPTCSTRLQGSGWCIPTCSMSRLSSAGGSLMSGLNMTRWNIKPRTNCLRISLCMSTAEGLTTTSGR